MRLAVEPGRAFSRDSLIELLWAAVPHHCGSHSLAQAITVLRAKLGRANVLIHRSTVAVAAGAIDVDVARLDECRGEVGGRFLEGFEIPGAPAFDHWRDGWHAKLLPRLRDCLVRHMDGGRRIGDFATVERHALVLAELDPLCEDAVRGIMEARAWVGDRTNALKAYADFEARLADELGARPAPELVRIANLLREGRRSPYRHSVELASSAGEKRFEPERLIGREREFGRLYDAWTRVRRREPCVLVLTGDPGVGKTTLTNAFASTCQMEGAVVARAQAYDAERELPFAVLAELVRQLTIQRAIGSAEPEALSELSRICGDILTVFPGVPKPAEWSAEIAPLRLADAFLKTITTATDEIPLVLVVDDVHAADNASVAILHVVARKLPRSQLALILAGRTSEMRLSHASHAVLTESSDVSTRILELEPLPVEAAKQLLRALGGEPSVSTEPDVEKKILAASRGNALALELITREWQTRGAASLISDLDRLNALPATALGIPRAIRAVFERQVLRLDRRTRSALDLAAVLGRRLGDLALYSAVNLSTAEAAESLTRLRDESLLREVQGELEFRNELLRAQAYYSVAAVARQHLHREIAWRLANRARPGADTVDIEVGWHFLRAGEPEHAVPFVLRGSSEAIDGGAPGEAQRILEAFTGMQDSATAASPAAKLLLARALMNQSKAQDAVPVIEELLECRALSSRDQATAARMAVAAEHLLSRDNGRHYHAAADRAIGLARETGNPELIASALFESARAGVETGDEERIASAREEIRLLLLDESSAEFPVVHYARGFCDYFSYDARSAAGSLRRAVDLLQHSREPGELSRALTGLGVCMVDLCEHRGAHESFERALELASRVSDDSRASIISANMCTQKLVEGGFPAAVEYGLTALRFARTARAQPTLSSSYLSLAEAYLMLGEEVRADACQREAVAQHPEHHNWKVKVEFLCQSAFIALLRGSLPEALDLVAAAERQAHGRERAIAPPVGLRLLQLFRLAHTAGPEAALPHARDDRERFRYLHPLLFLDAVACIAWLERAIWGRPTEQTLNDLAEFDRLGALGRKLQLTQEGFIMNDWSTGDRRIGKAGTVT